MSGVESLILCGSVLVYLFGIGFTVSLLDESDVDERAVLWPIVLPIYAGVALSHRLTKRSAK